MNRTTNPAGSLKTSTNTNTYPPEKGSFGSKEVTKTTSSSPKVTGFCDKGETSLKSREFGVSEKGNNEAKEKKKGKSNKVIQIETIRDAVIGLLGKSQDKKIEQKLRELFRINFGDISKIGRESKSRNALRDALNAINKAADNIVQGKQGAGKLLGQNIADIVLKLSAGDYCSSSGDVYNIYTVQWKKLEEILDRGPTKEERAIYDKVLSCVTQEIKPDQETVNKFEVLVLHYEY